MFLWSLEIKEMPKIFEAYQMLKKQGIVTEDPTHVLPVSSAHIITTFHLITTNCLIIVYMFRTISLRLHPFRALKTRYSTTKKNAQLLQKLLKSGKSGDLEAANRLIKSMAKEADKRLDFKTRMQSEMETVYNNAKVLSDMLAFYSPNDSSAEEKDLMKELFESCERLRVRLFKLAKDLSEDDPNLNVLLSANDELTRVINSYKHIFGITSNNNIEKALKESNVSKSKPKDLLDILSPLESPNVLNDVELLDDHISASIDLNNANVSTNLQELGELFSQNNIDSPSNRKSLANNILLPEPIRPSNSTNTSNCNILVNESEQKSKSGPMSALDELNALSQSLMKSNLTNDSFKNKTNFSNNESKTSLNELQKIQLKEKNQKENGRNETNDSVLPLTDLSVSLESIIPSDSKPITLYDKNQIKVILHLASNSPRIDVKVIVITIVNTNHFPVSNIHFLAAVPKVWLI